jgi:hypothetical protein
MKYELIEQKYEDKAKGSWSAERADTITELCLGIFDTLGLAIRFRRFLVEEKKYGGDAPTGVSASSAIYIRPKEADK